VVVVYVLGSADALFVQLEVEVEHWIAEPLLSSLTAYNLELEQACEPLL
jgi:hypothetical protein